MPKVKQMPDVARGWRNDILTQLETHGLSIHDAVKWIAEHQKNPPAASSIYRALNGEFKEPSMKLAHLITNAVMHLTEDNQ